MTGDTPITLQELQERDAERRKAELADRIAWEATPQGQAYVAAQRARKARRAEADRQWALEHQDDPFEMGRAANFAGAGRVAPDDMNSEQQDIWLAGYDSCGADED